MSSLNSPLITELLIIKIELTDLEIILDKNDTDEWPENYYSNILIATDRFYRIRNKLLKLFKTEEIDYILFSLDKNAGKC